MIAALVTSLTEHGGVGSASRHIASVLAGWATRRSIQFRCLSLNDQVGKNSLESGGAEVEFEGFARAKHRFAASAVRLALRRPRLVIAAHPNLAPLAAGMALLAPRLRYVAVAHGIEVWKPLPRLRRQALRRASMVLVPSLSTAGHVRDQGVSEDRIFRLPWALDPSLEPDSSSQDDGPALPARRVVLAVGQLTAFSRYKGVDTLIDSVPLVRRAVPALQLVIVGDGDDRPRLEARAREKGVSECVRFLGSVSREALLRCYAHCDVFALPSTAEGFGLVFLEAMAMGKPVVGCLGGGAGEVVENGVSGLLVPGGEPLRVAEALIRFLTDRAYSSVIGARGRERVQQYFQFDMFQTRLSGLVEDLCGF